MTNFKENLKKIMENSSLSAADVGKAIGVSRQTIGFWLRGETYPHGDNLEKLAEFLKIGTRELVFGVGDEVAAFPTETNTPPSGYVSIPEFRMKASAGNGYSNDFEEVMESSPCFYKQSFFTSRGIKPETCKRIKVDGDSMEPFLYDGDTVLFSHTSPINFREIKDGSIYVIGICGALKVKRLSSMKDGVVVRSENSVKYPDEIFRNEELNDLIIFGKVIEVTRTILSRLI